MENVDHGKKKPAYVSKKTIHKYVDKENAYGIASSKAFEVPLVITHVENFVDNDDIVDANDATHDGTDDVNVDAIGVTYDANVVTNDETIAINETYITPQAPPLNRDTKVHFELFTASEEDAQATQTSTMFTQIEQHPKA